MYHKKLCIGMFFFLNYWYLMGIPILLIAYNNSNLDGLISNLTFQHSYCGWQLPATFIPPRCPGIVNLAIYPRKIPCWAHEKYFTITHCNWNFAIAFLGWFTYRPNWGFFLSFFYFSGGEPKTYGRLRCIRWAK